MTKYLFILAIGVALTSSLASHSDAGFDPNFTGNSQFVYNSSGVITTTGTSASTRADGITNFAVYKTIDSDWTNDWTGGNSVDSSVNYKLGSPATGDNTTYVYFYQIVNTNPLGPEDPLRYMNLILPGGLGTITSAGFITDFVFNETGVLPSNPTGPLGNARLGILPDTTVAGFPIIPPDDMPGNGAPSETHAPLNVAAPFTKIPLTPTIPIEPNPSATAVQGLNGDTVRFLFDPGIIGTPTATLKFSSILFVTSNFKPVYSTIEIHDSVGSFADVAVPTPELGTFAMTMAALLTCGLVVKFRSKPNKLAS